MIQFRDPASLLYYPHDSDTTPRFVIKHKAIELYLKLKKLNCGTSFAISKFKNSF